MRVLAILATLTLASSTAVADPAPAESAKPAPAKATPTPARAPTPCKKVVVGRGLDRKVVCEISEPIVVKQGAAKPEVVIVPRDGKNVTGRPRSENRLNGLSPRLTH